MPGGRPPGRRPDRHPDPEAIAIARLQGESTGRMLGRIDERTAITTWLRWQNDSPKNLATRILQGEHSKFAQNR